MPEQHDQVSRRTFLSANAALLAGFGLSSALASPALASTRSGPSGPPGTTTDLARYRPVTVSSTAYGPTPAEFAVDRLAQTGVGGHRDGGPEDRTRSGSPSTCRCRAASSQ